MKSEEDQWVSYYPNTPPPNHLQLWSFLGPVISNEIILPSLYAQGLSPLNIFFEQFSLQEIITVCPVEKIHKR
jgi:hypothetical protein